MTNKKAFSKIWYKIQSLGNKVKDLYYLLRVTSIIIGIILAFFAFIGMTIPLEMSGDPKPELYATVDCEYLEAPLCVGEESKKLVGRLDDIREQVMKESERMEELKNKYGEVDEKANEDSTHPLNKNVLEKIAEDIGNIRDPNLAENLDYDCPENIVRVMNAKTLYNITVSNDGELEAKEPKAFIPNYSYAEVINIYTDTKKKYWGPNDITLGSTIYGGTEIKVLAWLSEKVGAQEAKSIIISNSNSGPAKISVNTPVIFLAALLHRYIKSIFYISLSIVIVHLYILLGKLKKSRKQM